MCTTQRFKEVNLFSIPWLLEPHTFKLGLIKLKFKISSNLLYKVRCRCKIHQFWRHSWDKLCNKQLLVGKLISKTIFNSKLHFYRRWEQLGLWINSNKTKVNNLFKTLYRLSSPTSWVTHCSLLNFRDYQPQRSSKCKCYLRVNNYNRHLNSFFKINRISCFSKLSSSSRRKTSFKASHLRCWAFCRHVLQQYSNSNSSSNSSNSSNSSYSNNSNNSNSNKLHKGQIC